MNEEERKQLDLIIQIINIDNKLQLVLEMTKKMSQREQPTPLDIITIDESLKNVYKEVELIKKYDISYNLVKQFVNNNKDKMTDEQLKAIQKLIEENT